MLAGVAAAQFAASLVLEVGKDQLIVPPSGVEAVVAGVAGGTPLVDVRLALEPGMALIQFTGRHVGNPVSVQLCGSEIMRPTVQTVIRDGTLRLPAPNLAAAERMAAILRGEATCAVLNE